MKNKKGTILIAEDNPTNMKLIRDVLIFSGYEIIEAYNGKDALDKIRQNKDIIDLILMDLQLPEIHGLELIKIIKSDDSTKHLTIFVISAYVQESDVKKALKAGCNNYITKPINLEDFLNNINAFFMHCIDNPETDSKE
jgi:two-component system, cell cycle response regulator DivK